MRVERNIKSLVWRSERLQLASQELQEKIRADEERHHALFQKSIKLEALCKALRCNGPETFPTVHKNQRN